MWCLLERSAELSRVKDLMLFLVKPFPGSQTGSCCRMWNVSYLRWRTTPPPRGRCDKCKVPLKTWWRSCYCGGQCVIGSLSTSMTMTLQHREHSTWRRGGRKRQDSKKHFGRQNYVVQSTRNIINIYSVLDQSMYWSCDSTFWWLVRHHGLLSGVWSGTFKGP